MLILTEHEAGEVYLLCSLQAVRSELIPAGLLPAAVRHHEAGNPQRPGEAEAPHKHLVCRLSVLTDVLKNRPAAALLLGSGRCAERGVAARMEGRTHVARAEADTGESHPRDRGRTNITNVISR